MTPTHRSHDMTDKLRDAIAALQADDAPTERECGYQDAIDEVLRILDARAALAAAPQPAMREETGMEHIARDMREGRFPERSPRQQVPVEDVCQCRPCRHEWFERECVHCGIAVADFLAAAPQPAPVDREALVEVIREARHKWICDDADGVGDDQDHTIADALLARGLRLPGETRDHDAEDAKKWRAFVQAVDEGRATATFAGRINTISTDLEVTDADDLHDEVAILISADAIRVVEGGDDAA